jgi:hypothetical protein
MQLKTIQKISMICMLMLSFSIAQAQKYELKFQLKEGQTYQLKQSTDQVINISVMGMNQEVKQQNVFEYDYLVEKVEDGVQTVKVTYVAIESNRESVQGNSSYNSRTDKDPDNPESKYMAAMIGESFTMKIDQMGEVLEVNGTDALLDKGLAQMEGLDESTMSTVKAQLKGQFGDEAMKSNMGQVSAFFPKKKVKVGKSWKKKAATESMMAMNMASVYKLEKVEDGKAYISVSTEITPGEGEPMEMGPMTMQYSIEGVQNGTMVLDLETGWTLAGEIDQDLGGNVQIDSPQIGVMDAPITIQSTISYGENK